MTTQQDYWRSLAKFQKSFTKNLKRKIKEVKAIKTGKMYRTTKGKIDKKTSMAEVSSTFYYKYVDGGTSRIKPRKITEKALKTHEVKRAMEEVVNKYVSWQINKTLNK